MWRNRLFFPLSNANRWNTTSSPASSLYSGLIRFLFTRIRLYAKYGKSYFLVRLSIEYQKVIDTLPRFVSGDSNNFYGGVSVFMVGDSN